MIYSVQTIKTISIENNVSLHYQQTRFDVTRQMLNMEKLMWCNIQNDLVFTQECNQAQISLFENARFQEPTTI